MWFYGTVRDRAPARPPSVCVGAPPFDWTAGNIEIDWTWAHLGLKRLFDSEKLVYIYFTWLCPYGLDWQIIAGMGIYYLTGQEWATIIDYAYYPYSPYIDVGLSLYLLYLWCICVPCYLCVLLGYVCVCVVFVYSVPFGVSVVLYACWDLLCFVERGLNLVRFAGFHQ